MPKTLLEWSKEYNKKWVSKGGKLTSWYCEYCSQMNETPRPKKLDVTNKGYWDSATTCVYCDKINFVKVYPSGKTVVKNLFIKKG